MHVDVCILISRTSQYFDKRALNTSALISPRSRCLEEISETRVTAAPLKLLCQRWTPHAERSSRHHEIAVSGNHSMAISHSEMSVDDFYFPLFIHRPVLSFFFFFLSMPWNTIHNLPGLTFINTMLNVKKSSKSSCEEKQAVIHKLFSSHNIRESSGSPSCSPVDLSFISSMYLTKL